MDKPFSPLAIQSRLKRAPHPRRVEEIKRFIEKIALNQANPNLLKDWKSAMDTPLVDKSFYLPLVIPPENQLGFEYLVRRTFADSEAAYLRNNTVKGIWINRSYYPDFKEAIDSLTDKKLSFSVRVSKQDKHSKKITHANFDPLSDLAYALCDGMHFVAQPSDPDAEKVLLESELLPAELKFFSTADGGVKIPLQFPLYKDALEKAIERYNRLKHSTEGQEPDVYIESQVRKFFIVLKPSAVKDIVHWVKQNPNYIPSPLPLSELESVFKDDMRKAYEHIVPDSALKPRYENLLLKIRGMQMLPALDSYKKLFLGQAFHLQESFMEERKSIESIRPAKNIKEAVQNIEQKKALRWLDTCIDALDPEKLNDEITLFCKQSDKRRDRG